MKFRKLLLSILLLASVALSTACSTTPVGKEGHERTTFLGIYTSEPEYYARIPFATLDLSANDLCDNPLPEGNRVTWFWGLITYTD